MPDVFDIVEVEGMRVFSLPAALVAVLGQVLQPESRRCTQPGPRLYFGGMTTLQSCACEIFPCRPTSVGRRADALPHLANEEFEVYLYGPCCSGEGSWPED